MDFLFARASNTDILQGIARNHKWSRLSEVEGALGAFVVDNMLVVAPGVTASSIRNSFLFDGHATCGDFALSSSGPKPHQHQLQSLYRISVHEPAGNNLSGVFVLVHTNLDKGVVDFVCDPLSQYNLFHVESAEFAVCSNNAYFTETFLKAIGRPANRTFSVAAHEASLGFGTGNRTALERVHLSPPDTLVRMCLHENTTKYLQLGHLAICSDDPDDQLRHTVSSLSRSMNTIHNQFDRENIVYDLTGGYDSRLVLAASLNAGISGQKYFRSNFGARPDIDIPDAIAREFGMHYAPFPQNFDGEEMTTLEFARRAVFRHQGQSTIYNYELGRNLVTEVVRIRGGIGEFARAVYNPKLKNSRMWRAKRTLKSLARGNIPSALAHAGLSGGTRLPSGGNAKLLAFLVTRNLGSRESYFTPHFKKQLKQNVHAQLEILLNLGVRETCLLNSLYLVDRSRRHYGFSSQTLNLSRPSFEPLANYDLWRFASQFNRHERAEGLPIHQLMSAMSPELLSFPYASSPFDNSKLGFRVFVEGSLAGAPIKPCEIKRVRPPQIIRPNNGDLKGATGHQAYILPLRREFFELLFSFEPSNEIWSYISRRKFEELYASDRQLEIFCENALMFMRLLHGLIWCSGTEDHIPISAKI